MSKLIAKLCVIIVKVFTYIFHKFTEYLYELYIRDLERQERCERLEELEREGKLESELLRQRWIMLKNLRLINPLSLLNSIPEPYRYKIFDYLIEKNLYINICLRSCEIQIRLFIFLSNLFIKYRKRQVKWWVEGLDLQQKHKKQPKPTNSLIFIKLYLAYLKGYFFWLISPYIGFILARKDKVITTLIIVPNKVIIKVTYNDLFKLLSYVLHTALYILIIIACLYDIFSVIYAMCLLLPYVVLWGSYFMLFPVFLHIPRHSILWNCYCCFVTIWGSIVGSYDFYCFAHIIYITFEPHIADYYTIQFPYSGNDIRNRGIFIRSTYEGSEFFIQYWNVKGVNPITLKEVMRTFYSNGYTDKHHLNDILNSLSKSRVNGVIDEEFLKQSLDALRRPMVLNGLTESELSELTDDKLTELITTELRKKTNIKR